MFYSVTYCLSDDSSLEAILQDVEEFAEDLAGTQTEDQGYLMREAIPGSPSAHPISMDPLSMHPLEQVDHLRDDIEGAFKV